ncbi:MAG: hypothetical protein FJ285_03715 [Planctomycetes bacterium]|nr:hypothetical protein [Planctomycetota bacterium]
MFSLPRSCGAALGGTGGARLNKALRDAASIAVRSMVAAATWLFTVGCSEPRVIHAPFAVAAPVIDGRGADAVWQSAAWSADFLDIEGPARTAPLQRTRVKMAWSDAALFILAELEETDLWATLRTHDEVVFHDNDFEVFVDPDGDGREYYEIEVNAYGTVFDLYLPRSYRAGGIANHGWTARGMQLAIALDGTLNDNRDRDQRWTVEMALPWSVFEPVSVDGAGASVITFQCCERPPNPGDAWRINFSRVQWQLEHVGTGYRKVSGRAEENWVWTPQWMIDMHVPQWWGRVVFDAPEQPR